MKTIETAYSPCPNDTFIFHAMINGLVDTKKYSFLPYTGDVEDLNIRAFSGLHPVTKMSYHAYLHLRNRYTALDSGSALGHGCGPLLVAKNGRSDFGRMLVAAPGRYTTAHLLLKLWKPEATNIVFARFDEIMQGVADGKFDAGLIIHEGRFVYPGYGLVKLIDLGEWWESETGLPIPLGCIAVRNDMTGIRSEIGSILRSSVEYAIKNPDDSRNYIKSLAQEMDDEVISEHIRLYVNEYTIDLGKKGRSAVKRLEEMTSLRGII